MTEPVEAVNHAKSMNHLHRSIPARVLFRTLRLQVLLLAILTAIRVGVELLPEPIRSSSILSRGLIVATIVVFTWGLLRVLSLASNAKVVHDSLTPGVVAILEKVLRLIVFSLMLLVIIDSLGISITPILASLGVGSVAVALALQDTLGNVFSGFYILIDRPLTLGDTVRLDTGIEGTVSQIGWRSTQLQIPSGDTVVIPNSKLASSVLTNFSLPAPETAALVECSVGYDANLEQVEKTAREVADAVMRDNAGGVPGYQSAVRFHTFSDYSIGFTVAMRAKRFQDRALLRHEFIKGFKSRMDGAGILFRSPLPQWTPPVGARDSHRAP